MKEATIEAKQGGERGITARSVKKVTAVSDALSTLKASTSASRELVVDNTVQQDSLAKFRG